ncbi:MAG: hypothetical protein H6555_03985 [Lewinellaceae bacterium]|nr:hypothetical protein [Lewinellaceae bacterium]
MTNVKPGTTISMRRSHLMLVTLLLLSACTATQWLSRSTAATAPFQAQGNFIESHGLVFLAVEIDSEDHYFLFDTGAGITVIDSTIFRTEKSISQALVLDAQDRQQTMPIANLPSLRIQGVLFSDIPVALGHLKGFPTSDKVPRVSGIIGASLFTQANWIFDFAREEFTITNQPIEGFSHTVPLQLAKDREPHINLSINGTNEKVELDMGSNRELVVGKASTALRASLYAMPGDHRITNRFALHGTNPDTTKIINNVPVLMHPSYPLAAPTIVLGNTQQSRVGNRFLQRLGRIGLDFQQQRLLLFQISG